MQVFVQGMKFRCDISNYQRQLETGRAIEKIFREKVSKATV